MKNIIAILFCLTVCLCTFAQKNIKNPAVYVDGKGIIRWTDTHKEASFFGINYTLPFSIAYRSMKDLNIDIRKAIDKDVYHFARMGINAYRIHLWDIEISDKRGNLICNEHLDLFDYLLSKLKERNIKIVITPMTHYGSMNLKENEPRGFSFYIDKCQAHLDHSVIATQAKFTYQLLAHVNPYTGLSYVEDPDIIAWEVDNEPCHKGTEADVKYYINAILKSYEKAGNKKPVFYNVTHNLQNVQAYFDTNIQGGTYQWYPTGLVSGHERKGNFLPNLDEYRITFRNLRNFNKMAKLVYEFDIPDVMYSHLYPAIARTFRSEGMQWLTMFAYDPLDLAWTSIVNPTHYLNYAYTPGKAISMKIASEVKEYMPLNKKYEPYPNDTIFECFQVSYLKDLSEMNTANKFLYSNHTDTYPIDESQLSEIMGCGCSPIVKYEGTGLYTLDKLEDGVWRLEVMPDVFFIRDPYNKPSIRQEYGTIMWNTWPMKINLSNLGPDYSFIGINDGNSKKSKAIDCTVQVSPGAYLLIRKDKKTTNWNVGSKWGTIRLNEFYAPAHKTYTYQVLPKLPQTIADDTDYTQKVTICGPSVPDSVALYHVRSVTGRGLQGERYKMIRTNGLVYEATIPKLNLHVGYFNFHVTVYKNGKPLDFPSVFSYDYKKDYFFPDIWEIPIVKSNTSIQLIDIDNKLNQDIEILSIPYDANKKMSGVTKTVVEISPTETPRMQISIIENTGLNVRYYARKFIKPCIESRKTKLNNVSALCIQIKNPKGLSKLEVGFVTNLGFTYTALIQLFENQSVYKIPIIQFRQKETALLPESYPVFMKRYFFPLVNLPFQIEDIESLEISTEPITNTTICFELGAVWLE